MLIDDVIVSRISLHLLSLLVNKQMLMNVDVLHFYPPIAGMRHRRCTLHEFAPAIDPVKVSFAGSMVEA